MKQRKKLIMLCGLMLAVSSPTYAENATEAVSISDTASVVELTSDANMETEMQSVSDSDTTETSAQETDQVALPAIWQETYTYLADTQDAHTFPEQIEKSGTSYSQCTIRGLRSSAYHYGARNEKVFFRSCICNATHHGQFERGSGIFRRKGSARSF